LKRIVPERNQRRKREATMRVSTGAPELIKRGASRYAFSDPYHLAVEMSWKEFALAFAGLELGINVVFALLYLARPGCVANMRPGSFSDAFFFSLETLATVGYGTMAPATLYGHAVSAIEIVCGMVFTAIMTGLLFVRFSKPRPRILFADQAVVTSHNCSPTLMVRIANGRMTLLTNAPVALPATPLPVPGVGRARWQLELIRCRAGESADFEVEACDAKGRLALSSNLAHGPAKKDFGRRRASG
jgi:inward rectifier potassium channel